MQTYKDKAALIEEIRKRHIMYDEEFNDIKEEERDLLKLRIDKLHRKIFLIS